MAITHGLIATAVSLGLAAANYDKIEAFYNDLITETQRIAAAGDMRTITQLLDMELIFKGRYPPPEQFSLWLTKKTKENNTRDVTSDVWGTPFQYTTQDKNRSFTLVSAGPDGEYDTSDDLRASGP